MSLKNILLASIVAILVSIITNSYFVDNGSYEAPEKKSSFKGVEDRAIIDCGYISYQPAIFNDENGKVVGIFAETMEKAANNLGWKVNWIEGNWPDLIPNLNAKRWDAYCAAAWKNAARIRAADFGIPLYYSYLSVWGKDSLKDVTLAKLNSSDYTVAVLDGDTSMAVADQKFKDAKRVSLTELNSYSDIFDTVTSGRADFTIAEASYVKQYNENRTGPKLVALGDGPIRIYPNAMMFRKEDIALRRAISGAVEELINEGFVDTLIEKYAKDEVLPVAKPYSNN